MEGFHQALSDSDLHDLSYNASRFTWENRCDPRAFVQERLDRAVFNPLWRSIFTAAKVYILENPASDCLPLFLSLGVQLYKYVQKRFSFENSWALESDCKKVVAEG